MILIIDNYDSFTYNLVQMVEALNENVKVIKNDELTIDEIKKLPVKGIIISPGPSTPSNAGICLDVVKTFYKYIPILGICLGHQTIAQAFGSKIIHAKILVHGKVDLIHHDFNGLYLDVNQDFFATRYHSLIVSESSLSNELMVTSRSKSDMSIMGVRHVKYHTEGLQFHPESYKTTEGIKIIRNFLNITRIGGRNV